MKISRTHIFEIIFLLLALVPLFFYGYQASLDGPQHLYNSGVIVEIVKGNATFQEYFDINKVLVGYWTGHLVLSALNMLFSALIAEKIFIAIYILSFYYSFKYFVKSYNKKPGLTVFLIIPFIYSSYFLLGYYTFCIAFIFYFLFHGYLYRYHLKLQLKQVVVLTILLFLVFLSHALIFALTLVSFGVYYFFIIAKKGFVDNKNQLKNLLVSIGTFLVITVPSIILWFLYIKHVMGINNTVTGNSNTIWDLVLSLYKLSLLVGFVHLHENFVTIAIFISIIFMLSYQLRQNYLSYKIINNLNSKIAFFNENYLFIVFIIGFLFYFFLPNRISAGSLTNRFALFFFINLIMWLSTKKYPFYKEMPIILVLFISVLYLNVYRIHIYKQLNTSIKKVEEIEKIIPENSIVYGIEADDNWLTLHFTNFVGVNKPIVNLSSPQNQGQFPVVWNYQKIKRTYLGNLDVTSLAQKDTLRRDIELIEYVVVIRNDLLQKSNSNKKDVLNNFYAEVTENSSDYATLFKFKYLDEYIAIKDTLQLSANDKKLLKNYSKDGAIKLKAIWKIENLYVK